MFEQSTKCDSQHTGIYRKGATAREKRKCKGTEVTVNLKTNIYTSITESVTVSAITIPGIMSVKYILAYVIESTVSIFVKL